MFSFSTSILSVKCDGNNVLNWGQTSHIDTIKMFRAEKSEKQATKKNRGDKKLSFWVEVRYLSRSEIEEME